MSSNPDTIFINDINLLDPSFIKGKVNLITLLENDISKLVVNEIKDLYPIYKQKFININEELFENAVKYVLYSNIPELYKDYKDQVKNWLISIDKKRQDLIKKEFEYKNANINYFILNCNIYSKLISSNELDIIKIIKEYPIDKNVPFMITRNKEIVIKFDKTFDTNIVKSWINKYKNIKELNNCIKVKILSSS